MEWGNIILVAVSGSVGVAGTLLGAILNNHFGRQQMKEAWAEEERRRKSDRRRELYEKDLSMVRDVVKTIVELKSRVGGLVRVAMDEMTEDELWERMARLGLMMETSQMIVGSFEDEELKTEYYKLLSNMSKWGMLVDPSTGKAKGGEEEEAKELAEQVESAASEVWRRMRERLEEV